MTRLNDPIWQKLYDDLVILARKNLGNLAHHSSEEDIACSAIGSYFRGIEEGRYNLPKDDGFSVWPLLSLMAARKCADLTAYLKAQKRDIGRMTDAELDEIIAKGDSPSSIVEQEENRQVMLKALPDDRLRQMAEWRMQGFTNREIAEKLGIVERSVERGVKLIREIWEKNKRNFWKDSVGDY